jgi:hypothetical protein
LSHICRGIRAFSLNFYFYSPAITPKPATQQNAKETTSF